MEFEEVVRRRKSIRRFTSKKVSLKVLEKIITHATYAPTPCNQQLWKFIAVTDDSIKKKLVDTAASSTIITRAPIVLIICYDGWNKKEAIQAGSLAVQNILLSAVEHGIGALSMNSYGNDKLIKHIIGIPKRYVITCFVLLGHPADDEFEAPPIQRRLVNEVLSFNTFDDKNVFVPTYTSDKWSKQKLTRYQQYYCRKTYLGKQMDLFDDHEARLVQDTLCAVAGSWSKGVDFFSYDGCYLQYFPSIKVTSVNLDDETERYVNAAVKLTHSQATISYEKYDTDTSERYDGATLIFKAERLPMKLRRETFRKAWERLLPGGELIIIARLPSLFYRVWYSSIKCLFGNDVRKTGIYAFFGPYEPIPKYVYLRELKRIGFRTQTRSYFLIPPFFNQVLQMLCQYIKSGGTTYLHRNKHIRWYTRFLEQLITRTKKWKGGSVLVLRARKPVSESTGGLP